MKRETKIFNLMHKIFKEKINLNDSLYCNNCKNKIEVYDDVFKFRIKKATICWTCAYKVTESQVEE